MGPGETVSASSPRSNAVSRQLDGIDTETARRNRPTTTPLESSPATGLSRPTRVLLRELVVSQVLVELEGVLDPNLQPTDEQNPNRVAVDETVIRLNDEQYWLYAVLRNRRFLMGCTRALLL